MNYEMHVIEIDPGLKTQLLVVSLTMNCATDLIKITLSCSESVSVGIEAFGSYLVKRIQLKKGHIKHILSSQSTLTELEDMLTAPLTCEPTKLAPQQLMEN